MATERIEIDTASAGFQAAVKIRRAALAFQAFRLAWDESVELERARIRAEHSRKQRHLRAFNALVDEYARAGQ